MKEVFVFPGQGAQKLGMGRELFDQVPEFAVVEKEIDGLLGYSVRTLCLEGPDDCLAQTQFTQPCLYVVNALHYYSRIAQGDRPDAVAGHSLGEYNALLAAGVFDLLTGLRLVQKRGELMAQVNGGGMAAVIGVDEARVVKLLEENGITDVDVANYNSPSQVVIAGPTTSIGRAKAVLEAAEARMVVPLRVSGAFHSCYMTEVGAAFAKFLAPIEFREPQIPVLSNVTARPHAEQGGIEAIKALLARQIYQPVRWTQSIQYLIRQGAVSFVELGPTAVLTRLIGDIRKVTAAPAVAAVHSEPASPSLATSEPASVTAPSLGDEQFKADYRIKYAYLVGAMYKGIASKEMVAAAAKRGLMGYFGAGGLELAEIESAIRYIQAEISPDQVFGVNLLCNLDQPSQEEQTVDLLLRCGVRYVEAAAFVQMTPALIRYRLTGLRRMPDGSIHAPHFVLAKVSRPEIAAAFMRPAPEPIVKRLVETGCVSAEVAELARLIPVAGEVCVEADSGGHTDRGVAFTLIPAIRSLRDELMTQFGYAKPIRVGAAGGIGTPEAAAAAFVLGADFILTGSINQCTVEARTSDVVKDMLQDMNVQDTAYAPAGDMFESGAKVQVYKKGLFFPARANKLYELYTRHASLEEIDDVTRRQIEEKYFDRSLDEVWCETREHYLKTNPNKIAAIEAHPKQKMALTFKWYFAHSTRLAMSGSANHRLDYQIHCGPALGAFNQWVKGTRLERWRNRHVADIGERIMQGAAQLLDARIGKLIHRNTVSGEPRASPGVFQSEARGKRERAAFQ